MTKGCPRAIKMFGRDLRAWLYKDPGGWNVLPRAYATWVSGGCWILARGLHEWIGPKSSLWAVYSGDLMQHVVVKVGACYLDGDGASTKKELLDRWEKDEHLSDLTLKPFVAEEADEIQCPIGAVRDLVRELIRSFGPRERGLEMGGVKEWRPDMPDWDPDAPVDLDEFTRSYLETALWSSFDENGNPLEDNYEIGDFSREAIQKAIRECDDFRTSNEADLEAGGRDADYNAHDFWLTRNRHGTGFWDGDYPEPIGRRLTEAAHSYGEINIVIGDDGKLHFS